MTLPAGGARKDAWAAREAGRHCWRHRTTIGASLRQQGADYTSSGGVSRVLDSGGGHTRCCPRGFPEWAPTPALPEASISRVPPVRGDDQAA